MRVIATFVFNGLSSGGLPVVGSSILTLRSNSRGTFVNPNIRVKLRVQGVSPVTSDDYVEDQYGNKIYIQAPPNAKLQIEPSAGNIIPTILL